MARENRFRYRNTSMERQAKNMRYSWQFSKTNDSFFHIYKMDFISFTSVKRIDG